MAKKDPTSRVTFRVSTAQRPDFKHALAAYAFDSRGELIQRADVRDGKVELALSEADLGKTRVFIAPVHPALDEKTLSPRTMERIRAYEPVLRAGGKLVEAIDIPNVLLEFWPLCFCWVRGKVVRAADNRAVCNARVHICEVDRVPLLIERLPDRDIFRLRDDLLEIIRRPPIPRPWPPPEPDPGPFPTGPGPDLAPFSRSTLRFSRAPGGIRGFDPQPDPPGADEVGFNPQPEPPISRAARGRLASPGSRVSLNPQPLPPRERIQLPAELQLGLRSNSPLVVRNLLIANYKLLLPWFCYWPHWWWWFRCDEVAVVMTDGHGRFETTIFYWCGGDHPDLYFWVEYDFGSGFETIYHPWIACHTYWNYVCGSEVTIRVTDPRVPGCEEEPDLPGCQVVVLSIGNGVAVREVQTSGGQEGLTTAGEPFGATLEPRVDFSRTELITVKNIPYYRWSYRRLTGPDGASNTVDPGSVPLNSWTIMTRDVYRHYKVGTTYPSDLMGPMPTMGPSAAPAPNLFRIRPLSPPAGDEWVVLNEHIDLATAYFDTASLSGSPSGGPPWPDDLAAGKYEIKLELFNNLGNLVNWTDENIELRITNENAPFGPGTIATSLAPNYNRVLDNNGKTIGFRMVVRVDNNRCAAEILPVGGDVTADPVCGFHNYSDLSDDARLSCVARHPNNFARYSFVTERGTGPTIPAATTTGVAGEPGTGGFTEVANFTYSKDVSVSDLVGSCSNAAFSERLDVHAMATNGYSTLTGYNAADNAAFALAVPCPECECEDDDDDDD